MSTHGSDGLIGSLGYASTAPQPADGFVDFDEIFSFPGWSSRSTFLLLLDSFMTFPLRLLLVLLTPSTRATRRRLVVHGAWRGGPARQEIVVARRSCVVPARSSPTTWLLRLRTCAVENLLVDSTPCMSRALSRCCGVETMLDLSPGTTTTTGCLSGCTNY
jgi:hypothetical protein